MRYGFGFYRWGFWFGIGQMRLRRWALDICLFTYYPVPEGYNRIWWTIGK